MSARFGLAIAAAFSLLACGSDSSNTTEPPLTALNGSMSATVNGASWTATVAVQAGYVNSILAFDGVAGNNTTIVMALAPTAGPGTYPISINEPTNAGYTLSGGQAKVWQAASTQGSGSVELQTLTDASASGTFHFELPAIASSGATGTTSVTNGKFDVKF